MDCSHDESDVFEGYGPPPGRRARRNAVPDVGESLRLEMQMAQMENRISMCRLSISTGGGCAAPAPQLRATQGGWNPPNCRGGTAEQQQQLKFSPTPAATTRMGPAPAPASSRGAFDPGSFARYDDPELEPFSDAGYEHPSGWGEPTPAPGATMDAGSLPSKADFERLQVFTVQEAGSCGRWGSNRSTGSCHSAMSFMSDDVYRP